MQVALAWLLQRAPNILLIPGTSSLEHLRENLAAASLKLPGDALTALDEIAKGRGARASDALAAVRPREVEANMASMAAVPFSPGQKVARSAG